MTRIFDIRAARINRGLSCRQAAEKIGIPEPTLRRIEREQGAHPANAKKIADFFGLQVTDIWPIEEPEAAA